MQKYEKRTMLGKTQTFFIIDVTSKFRVWNSGHVWNEIDDKTFLWNIGDCCKENILYVRTRQNLHKLLTFRRILSHTSESTLDYNSRPKQFIWCNLIKQFIWIWIANKSFDSNHCDAYCFLGVCHLHKVHYYNLRQQKCWKYKTSTVKIVL